MRVRLLVALTATLVSAADAQPRFTRAGAPAAPSADRGVRNPSYLRAVERLARTAPGVAPRVRFEWERVRGSTEYLLAGRWADARSWALRSLEYRVTPGNAASWRGDHVAFEVSLPEGSHSWTLVAVFGPNETGDLGQPARVSFTLR